VDATPLQNGDPNVLLMALQAAVNPGEIWRARDGRAVYYAGADAGAIGQTVRFLCSGRVNVPKTTGISILDGGQVFWHWDNNLATFKRRTNSKDFYLGTAYGDYDPAASLMTVNLNVARRPNFFDFDLDRDPFTTVIIKTAGSPLLNHRGGAWDLLLDSTNEAEKVDALGNDSLQAGARAIVEAGITIVNGGAAGARTSMSGSRVPRTRQTPTRSRSICSCTRTGTATSSGSSRRTGPTRRPRRTRGPPIRRAPASRSGSTCATRTRSRSTSRACACSPA
jgi:hypothetical protein